MSNWAENIAKNAAAARVCCADKLGAISRLVSCSFDDLRHGSWQFYQNDHPFDRIETAMTWAEALVRRVILSLVTEMRREKTSNDRRLPSSREPMRKSANAAHLQPGFPSSRESATNLEHPLLHRLEGAATLHPQDPPRPYRPTFQWSELRPAPTIPTGKTTSTPRPKPRKYDFKTKVEARLALFAHMLEHKEAYAKRLAYRLSTVGRVKAEPDPTPSPKVSVPPEGLEPTYCPAEPENEGKNPPPPVGAGGDQKLNSISADKEGEAALSTLHVSDSDTEENENSAEGGESLSRVIPCAMQHENAASQTRDPDKRNTSQVPHLHRSIPCRSACGMTPERPKLVWSLYTTDPPPIDTLKDDLVALHMAYEQP